MTFVFASMLVFSLGIASAQLEEDLGNPGITPDSTFYFLDRFFDGFQSAESLADEKAAETVVMAQEGKEKEMNRSLELYEKNLEKLKEKSQNNEKTAEKVANQTTRHMVVLAGVLEQVPEEAKSAIERAMENSVRGREEAVNALKNQNPEKGEQVAQQTLQRVMSETPEQAQEGLQKAFNNVGSESGEEFSQAHEEFQKKGQGIVSGGDTENDTGQANIPGDNVSGEENTQGQETGANQGGIF